MTANGCSDRGFCKHDDLEANHAFWKRWRAGVRSDSLESRGHWTGRNELTAQVYVDITLYVDVVDDKCGNQRGAIPKEVVMYSRPQLEKQNSALDTTMTLQKVTVQGQAAVAMWNRG